MPDGTPNVTRARRLAAGLCRDCGQEPIVRGGRGERCIQQQKERWRQKRLAEVAQRAPKSCLHCGVVYGVDYKPKGGKPRKFCSRSCNQQHQASIAKTAAALRRPAMEVARQESKNRTAERKQESRLQAHLATADCVCRICGVHFSKPLHGSGKPRYCSVVCRQIAKTAQLRKARQEYGHKPAERARKRGLPYERCGPIAVCTRDRWRCQICGCSTPRRLRGSYDLRAPEVDHIIPLANPGSPGHVWSNVQCLCRRCNLAKRDKPLGQLRIELSEEPVTY